MDNLALGYIRVSTERQARDGDSLDAQRARLNGYAAAHNLQLTEIIADEGVSGSVPLAERPGGKRLVGMVGPVIKNVVITKFDRAFRGVVDSLVQIDRWKQLGVRVHALDFGGMPLDTGSAMGQFIVTMRAAVAEMERTLAKERTLETFAHKRAKGEPLGQLPWGYVRTDDGLVVEHKARGAAIMRMRELHDDGHSYREIASFVTDEYKAYNMPISHSAVARIITNKGMLNQ